MALNIMLTMILQILITRNTRKIKIEINNIEAKKENLETSNESVNESINTIKKSF